jgi:hypothetical protein
MQQPGVWSEVILPTLVAAGMALCLFSLYQWVTP